MRNGAFLLLSAFYAMGNQQADFNVILHSPAFFAFNMPSVAPETLQQLSENIEIAQIGANVLVMKK